MNSGDHFVIEPFLRVPVPGYYLENQTRQQEFFFFPHTPRRTHCGNGPRWIVSLVDPNEPFQMFVLGPTLF